MKKGMKTELTREKIISAALQEFGLCGYEGASVNAVAQIKTTQKIEQSALDILLYGMVAR